MLTRFIAAVLALCLSGAAYAQEARTPERQALLTRLAVALPPSGLSAEEQTETLRQQLAPVARELRTRYPDRAADIDAAIDTYARCMATGIFAAAPGLAVQAADESMSDAELTTFTEFYEGPGHPRFSAIIARINRGEQVSPEERSFVDQLTADPAMLRFATRSQALAQGYLETAPGRALIDTCGADLRQVLSPDRRRT